MVVRLTLLLKYSVVIGYFYVVVICELLRWHTILLQLQKPEGRDEVRRYNISFLKPQFPKIRASLSSGDIIANTLLYKSLNGIGKQDSDGNWYTFWYVSRFANLKHFVIFIVENWPNFLTPARSLPYNRK